MPDSVSELMLHTTSKNAGGSQDEVTFRTDCVVACWLEPIIFIFSIIAFFPFLVIMVVVGIPYFVTYFLILVAKDQRTVEIYMFACKKT